jgi:hypothetical protein
MEKKSLIVTVLSFFVFILLLSCSSEFDCLKSTGKIVTENRKILPFFTLVVKDNINVEITDQSDSVVSIEAGEHLIGKIQIKNEGDKLTIANLNTCNWTRSYKPEIKVKIGIRQGNLAIQHYGYGKIYSNTILPIAYLNIDSFNAGGNVDLQVENNFVGIYSNSHADLKISGKTQVLQVMMDGIGRVRAEALKADSCQIQHNGSNEVRTFPLKKLVAVITKNGKIIYYHQPDILLQTISTEGKLLHP